MFEHLTMPWHHAHKSTCMHELISTPAGTHKYSVPASLTMMPCLAMSCRGVWYPAVSCRVHAPPPRCPDTAVYVVKSVPVEFAVQPWDPRG